MIMRYLLALYACMAVSDIDVGVDAAAREIYTTNMLCQESRCVNPIFPAFQILGTSVLEEQDKRSYKCIHDALGETSASKGGPVVS